MIVDGRDVIQVEPHGRLNRRGPMLTSIGPLLSMFSFSLFQKREPTLAGTMTNHTALQEDKRLTRQASLQREVLTHLAWHGPTNRMRIYAGFDETPLEEIEPVLDELRQLGYMEIGPMDMVLLTASGREWLKSGK
jgi:hypothetical protein